MTPRRIRWFLSLQEWLILPQTGINLCIDFRCLFYFTKETTVFFVQTFSFLRSCAYKPWNRGEEGLEPCYINKLAYQESLVWACERHPSTIASPCSASLLHTSPPAEPSFLKPDVFTNARATLRRKKPEIWLCFAARRFGLRFAVRSHLFYFFFAKCSDVSMFVVLRPRFATSSMHTQHHHRYSSIEQTKFRFTMETSTITRLNSNTLNYGSYTGPCFVSNVVHQDWGFRITMEASPGSDNFCSTFFSSSPISHGGDGLPTICLWFIVYPSDIYEFTFDTFYYSNMLLSIAYFAWGRVIIYDDNLSYRSLSL